MTFRLRLQRKLLAEKYLCEKKVFPINFRLSAHDSLASGKKTEGSSKLHSTCPEENFVWELFFRKKNSSLSVLQLKKPKLFTESSVTDVKSSFHVSRRMNFWGNRNLRRKNFQYIFPVWQRRFQSFVKVFSRDFRTPFYLSSRSIPGKFILEMWCICVVSPYLGQDVSDFLRRVFYWNYQKIFSLAQNFVLVVTSVWKLGFIFQISSKKDSGLLWKF